MNVWAKAAALFMTIDFSLGCRYLGVRTETTVVFDGRTIVQDSYPGPRPGQDDRWEVEVCRESRRGFLGRFFYDRSDHYSVAKVVIARDDFPVVREDKKTKKRKIVWVGQYHTVFLQENECKIPIPNFRRGEYGYFVWYYLSDPGAEVSINQETGKPVVLGCSSGILTFRVTSQRDNFRRIGGHTLVLIPDHFVETGCPAE